MKAAPTRQATAFKGSSMAFPNTVPIPSVTAGISWVKWVK